MKVLPDQWKATHIKERVIFCMNSMIPIEFPRSLYNKESCSKAWDTEIK